MGIIKLTNSLIKAKATDALVYRGKCMDMDQCLSPGYYLVEPGVANIPEGVYPYGILTVKKSRLFDIAGIHTTHFLDRPNLQDCQTDKKQQFLVSVVCDKSHLANGKEVVA